jgi:protein involved in temperature-dependent protein secretion
MAKTRACAAPGTVYEMHGGRLQKTSIDKTYCGSIEKVTSIKHGDFRVSQHVVVISAGGRKLWVPVSRIKAGKARHKR